MYTGSQRHKERKNIQYFVNIVILITYRNDPLAGLSQPEHTIKVNFAHLFLLPLYVAMKILKIILCGLFYI